jgi:hypothetical protein
MKPRHDLNGRTFGKLTVLGPHTELLHRYFAWRVRCECGIEKVMTGRTLVGGHSRSCGCVRKSKMRARSSFATRKKIKVSVGPTDSWLKKNDHE